MLGTHTHTHKYTYTYTNTHIHTYTYTHKHTHTHHLIFSEYLFTTKDKDTRVTKRIQIN